MQRRAIVGLSVAVCAIFGAAAYWYSLRSHGAPTSLVATLPSADASVIYVDVDALRRSGILGMLQGAKTSEDPDYQQFVRDTQFDYRHDLDALAGAVKDGRTYFALRGRFHWKNLSAYAAQHGGSCHDNFCVTPGSQADRRISFYLLKPDLLALAVAPDDFAAYQVAAKSAKNLPPTPKEPVWASIPASALQSAGTLPSAAQAFVPALKGADQIVFSLGGNSGQQLELALHVTCKDSAGATVLIAQLESITKELRDVAARQHRKADPADLSALLVAGNFRRDERQVYGTWPIPKAFVDAFAGSVY
ncbi:MAG TPA: hypothetical protein VFW44_05525 [Bryobacteraceae bacterium]|nr:hypothetical protein [Bryobacteraceae bacterium]